MKNWRTTVVACMLAALMACKPLFSNSGNFDPSSNNSLYGDANSIKFRANSNKIGDAYASGGNTAINIDDNSQTITTNAKNYLIQSDAGITYLYGTENEGAVGDWDANSTNYYYYYNIASPYLQLQLGSRYVRFKEESGVIKGITNGPIKFDSLIAPIDFNHGEYLPSSFLLDTSNIKNIVFDTATYAVVGDVVTVSGRLTVDKSGSASSGGNVLFEFTLPVSSTLTNLPYCNGTANSYYSQRPASIYGITSSGRASFYSRMDVTSTQQVWSFIFQYRTK